MDEVYDALKSFEEDETVRWDYVGKEVDYFRTPETSDCKDELLYTQKGDFDILALDRDNCQAYIAEVKGSPKGATKGYRQLKKAEEHFKALGWDTIPCLLIGDKNGFSESETPTYASD